MGNDEIAVYEDRIIESSTSIASIFLKGKTYYIRDIKSAYIPIEAKSTTDEMVAATILLTILPNMRRIKRSHKTIINLKLKTGKVIQIPSSFDRDKMERVTETVNTLISNQSLKKV
jgi:hypothetical protein